MSATGVATAAFPNGPTAPTTLKAGNGWATGEAGDIPGAAKAEDIAGGDAIPALMHALAAAPVGGGGAEEKSAKSKPELGDCIPNKPEAGDCGDWVPRRKPEVPTWLGLWLGLCAEATEVTLGGLICPCPGAVAFASDGGAGAKVAKSPQSAPPKL